MKKAIRIVRDGHKGELSIRLRNQVNTRKNEIIRRIEEGTLSYNHVMAALQAIIEGRIEILPNRITKIMKSWETFYKRYFGLTSVNFSGLRIPFKYVDDANGKWRLLVILGGLTNNLVYDACDEQFPCSKYTDDLDKDVLMNERDRQNGTYAIWVRDTVEADKIHNDKTADMIKKECLKTETLLERMLHELLYFSETGKHLDVNSITLCSGSRRSGGKVPLADWGGDEFRVRWCRTDDRSGSLRSREVVD